VRRRWRNSFASSARAERPRQTVPDVSRGIVGALDWRFRRVRWTVRTIHALTLVFLLVAGLGPLLWLAKSAITPTQDTLRMPMALWPHGFDLNYLTRAWSQTHIDRYFMNTVYMAIGSWATQLIVATTAGYALSILRPPGTKILTALVMATLFVPSIVLLVPLYLSIVDVPFLHIKLINTFWAVWLPYGASAFNVLLVKRFFDNLPTEVFEAAKVDGAGPFRSFARIAVEPRPYQLVPLLMGLRLDPIRLLIADDVADTGATLDEHLVPGAGQLTCSSRRERDPVLILLDFLGNPDDHR